MHRRLVQLNPTELKFAKTHEWISIPEDATSPIATVGISSYAVEALTDLVFIELPEEFQEVEVEESFCEVESVKAFSDIYAPVDGIVTEINNDLPDNLEILNTDPYGQGWIAKVQLSDLTQLDNLLDYETYQQFCKEEGH